MENKKEYIKNEEKEEKRYMMRCYEVRGCPGSHYLYCVAYKEDKNCWEVANVPCCKRNDKSRCLSCPVYQKAMNKIST